ncbi:ATP phosphoribosyltransferase catalytic subunit [Desulfitobacterium dichloroeliminans LMG P-21439]|uniref:ATP phosphoribosyltransferase n=1 Tax=Desulfitobacterium dichloroeliminans (strain LMG P-21439 / DCA1) TaxID=871963 RepID=L0F7W0_DESDL|nr:ATP phosphoribosyltransferase [Desulfitobacterium dichloroeliminans]AGA68746.1 ATP phosphoribosyltransferase catalytic subunit [Desulfitobacterium dichloroeliminans LMG P-21439]
MARNFLTIALPKGKLLIDSLEALTKIGIDCEDVSEASRKLVFPLEKSQAQIIICRPTDIPTFVEYGAADVGFVGKDTLLEENKDVVELLDLGFGYCRFVVAMPEEKVPPLLPEGTYDLSALNHQRVATKFPRVAEEFFRQQGMQVLPIKLHGNIELAPRVGLSEMIVDIVSTGTTLKQNKLVEVAPILEATTRLIANRVAYRMKYERINELTEKLRQIV